MCYRVRGVYSGSLQLLRYISDPKSHVERLHTQRGVLARPNIESLTPRLATLLQVARPRRASRAPVRLGDENSVVSTSAAAGHNPRLIGKTSTASLAAAGRLVGGKPTVSVSTAGGAVAGGSKISVGVAPVAAGSRRALGDVSNANSRVSS